MVYADWFNDIQKREEKKAEEKKETKVQPDFGMKLVIDELVYEKVMHWVNKSNYEVSGLGKVVLDKETNVIRVVDAILLPQENTTTHTDIDPAAVGKAMFLLKDAPGDLRWWWHSHANMSVFWSGTDMTTMKDLGMGGWFTATVFNQSNEMKSAFVQSSPVRLIADDISCAVDKRIDPFAEHRNEWDKSYEENVKNKTYSYSSTSNYSLLGNDDGPSPRQRSFYEIGEPKYRNDYGVTREVGADAEEDVEELTLDEIFEQHTKGEISNKQLYEMMNELYEEDEGEAEGEDDNYNVLSDDEADAMDLANHGRTFSRED
jgi:hypothetical protein